MPADKLHIFLKSLTLIQLLWGTFESNYEKMFCGCCAAHFSLPTALDSLCSVILWYSNQALHSKQLKINIC